MKKISIALVAAAFATAGCATKEYVHEYVAPISKRVDAEEASIQALNGRIDGVSRTAQEALDRATAAGKLAEGKLMYEVVMSDDKLKFKFDNSDLSDEGKQLLNAFADKLKAENKNVYIEIQGHTDNQGKEAYNLKLGAKRADAVLRHLNMRCGIPLHRMATISYGESAPIADNKKLEERKQNRRVVLVVLK